MLLALTPNIWYHHLSHLWDYKREAFRGKHEHALVGRDHSYYIFTRQCHGTYPRKPDIVLRRKND